MGQKDLPWRASRSTRSGRVPRNSRAVAPIPPVTIVVERTRLVEPRLVSPAEADTLFRPRVIEIDTGR